MAKKGGPKGEIAPPWQPCGKGWSGKAFDGNAFSGKALGGEDWGGKGEGWDDMGWNVSGKGWDTSCWDYGKGWGGKDFHGWDGKGYQVKDSKEWEDSGWHGKDGKGWLGGGYVAEVLPADAAAGKGPQVSPAVAEVPLADTAGSYGLGLQIDGKMSESETALYNSEMTQPYIKKCPVSPETTSYCVLCDKWPYPTHILGRGHSALKSRNGQNPQAWCKAPWEIEPPLQDAAAGAADPQMKKHEADLQQHRQEQDQLALQALAEQLRVQQEDEKAAAAAEALRLHAHHVPQTPMTPAPVSQEDIINVCNDVVDLVVGLEWKFNGLVQSLTQANIVQATVNNGVEAVEDRSRSPRLRTIEYARRVTMMLSQQQHINNQQAEAAQAAAQARAVQLAHQLEAEKQQQLADAAAAAALAQQQEAIKRQQMADAAVRVAKAKAPPTAVKTSPATPPQSSLTSPAPVGLANAKAPPSLASPAPAAAGQ